MSEQIWNIQEDALVWRVKKGQAHTDKIEMSGLYCDLIAKYGVDEEGGLVYIPCTFFPMLRTIPNNTHATFYFNAKEALVRLVKDGEPLKERPVSFRFDGILTVETETDEGLSITRRLFPSADRRFTVERVFVSAKKPLSLTLSQPNEVVASYGRGTKGVYICTVYHTAPEALVLSSGETAEFTVFYTARIANETLLLPTGKEEEEKRRARIKALCDGALVLETGRAELDTMARLAKLRAGESIFQTITGKYHSPGGISYYAATWCNDQVEYAGPHFAITNDEVAIEASLNAYRAYIPFMSEAYTRIPSSIIAEGLDIWEGAGDRGDAAMYLYGASFFSLALGKEETARELYPAIKWCAEYCERKKTPEGVISSDSDELEGRFPTDKYANLSTSSLCYGGLRLAARLARALGETEDEALFTLRADALEAAIESYFGATLHGFKTYRYSRGFDTLRAWICLPLCMGITERAEGTLEAMLSSYLWTEEGMLSCEMGAENKSGTIWDRATLYGMKCAFLSGMGDRMIEPLLAYCHKRLVCDHIPYAVEAYPEGDKRHLSAESALFARVVTEGLFGILPESLDSFSFIPRLPKGVPFLHLRAVYIAGGCFDILVEKEGYTVIESGKTVAKGKTDGQKVLVKKGA